MNCIDLAIKAAAGRLTNEEVNALIEEADQIRAALRDKGITDNLDARAMQIAERRAMDKKVEAARLRRQVAQNIKVRDRLDAHIGQLTKGGMSPVKALRATWEGSQRGIKGARVSGFAQAQAYEAKWIGSAFAEIQRDRPAILHMMTDKTFDTDVTREMWELREGGRPGITGNSDAKYLARVLAGHLEMSRTELNRMGAAIGKLEGYAGPQTHDDLAMLAVSKDKWVADVVPLLDLDRSFPDAGTEIEAKAILGDIYDTIITGVPNKATPLLTGQRVGPAGLAKSMGKHRVMHFKDADAAIKYRDTYGRGSTIQGIFSSLKRQAHIAGAMDTYGPNPRAMVGAIAAKMQKDMKAKIATMPEGKAKAKAVKELEKLNARDGDVVALKSTMDSITGALSKPDHHSLAAIGQGIRNWEGYSKLGGAVVTAMPSDFATMASAAMFRGQGFWAGALRSLGEFANRKDGKEIGFLLGEGFDGLSGHIASVAHDGVPGLMSRTAEHFYKWSGLSGWTDAARAVSARVTAAHLGSNAGKTFDKLDPRLAHVLGLNGIDAAKWEAIRASHVKQINGRSYITPDAVRDVPDDLIRPIVAQQIADARAAIVKKGTPSELERFAKKEEALIDDGRRGLELDLHRYYADEASYSVVETDAASRRVSTLGTRPGTIAGEAVRFIMQFKGFPIAFTQRILGRALLNAPTGRAGQAAHIGSLLAGLTVAGYMAMTVKDMARGLWPPRDPTSPSTMLAAMMQGGSLGIYGDFLFGKVSRFGQGPVETLSGPTVGAAAELYNIYTDALNGDAKAGKYLDLAINNTPYLNLFYTRPALDILFLNALREKASPGYLARQSRTIQQERGQTFALPRRAF